MDFLEDQVNRVSEQLVWRKQGYQCISNLFITSVRRLHTCHELWFLVAFQLLTACPSRFSISIFAFLLKSSLPNPTSFLSQQGRVLVTYAVPLAFVGGRAGGPAVAILIACVLWWAW